MTVKTLEYRYKVSGFKDVSDSLRRLKIHSNESLKRNQELLKTSKLVANNINKIKIDRTDSKSTAVKNSQTNKESSVNQKNIITQQDANLIAEAIASELYIFDKNFGKTLTKSFQDAKKGNIFGAIFRLAFKPINEIVSGFYSGIGQKIAGKYLDGILGKFKEDLGFSVEELGRNVGGNITQYAKYIDFKRIKNKFSAFSISIEELNKSLSEYSLENKLRSLEKAFGSFAQIIASPIDTIAAAYSKYKLDTEGLPAAQKRAKKIVPPNLEGKDEVIIGIGGFAGKKGKRGKNFTDALDSAASEKTAVIYSDNRYTDIKTSLEKDAGKWAIEVIQKKLKLLFKGFNPDAISAAAKAIAIRQKYPDIKIKFVGHSAGGFVAQQAQEIVNLAKLQNITSVGVATPKTIGGIDPEGHQKYISQDELIGKISRLLTLVGLADSTDKNQQIKGITDHGFQAYIDGIKELRDYLGITNDQPDKKENKPDVIDKISFNEYLLDLLNPENLLEFASLLLQSSTKTKAVNKAYDKFVKSFQSGNILKASQDFKKLFDLVSNNLQESSAQNLQGQFIRQRRENAIKNKAGNLVDKEIEKADIVKTNAETERVVIGIGGAANKGGRSGSYVKRTLEKYLDKKTQVDYIDNQDSDLSGKFTDDELLSLEQFNKSLRQFVTKGFSTDSIRLAAKVIATRQETKVPIDLVGYSYGGLIVEEAIKILKELGELENVKGYGVATPNLTGGFDDIKNYTAFLGKEDQIRGDINPEQIRNTPYQELENTDTSNLNQHQLEQYLQHPVVAGKLGIDLQKIDEINKKEIIKEFKEYVKQVKEKLVKKKGDFADFSREKQIEESENLKQKFYNALLVIEEEFQEILNKIGADDSELNSLAKDINKIWQEIDNSFIDFKTQSILGQTTEQPKTTTNESIPPNLENPIDPILAEEIKNNVEETINEVVEINDSIEEFTQITRDYVAEYKNYLDNIVAEARASATEKIIAFVPDYKNMTVEQKQQYSKQFYEQKVKKPAAEFRRAIRENNLVLAKEIGANLLRNIQYTKKIYQDLQKAAKNDYILQNKLPRQIGALTSLETEIRQGQPNQGGQGRVTIGIEPLLQRQIEESASLGENVKRAFVYAIVEDLDAAIKAGKKLGDSAIKGAADSLEINSPSKIFQQMGKWVVEGFLKGIEEFENIRLSINDEISAAVDPSKNIFQQFSDSVLAIFKVLKGKLLYVFGSLGEIFSILNVFKLLIQISSLGKFVEAFDQIGNKALEAAIQVERLDNQIIKLSKNKVEGQKNLKFLDNLADRLGVDLKTVKDSFSGILGATRNSPLEGEQTRQIYEAFLQVGTARGLNSEEQGRLLKAVEQIISKGVLQSEEVRGQIGDLLGGFEQSLASSLGISTSSLTKLMEDRQLSAIDVLPKVANQLKAENVVAVDNVYTAVSRLDNAIFKFQATLGKTLQPIQKSGLTFLTNLFTSLTEQIDFVIKSLTGLLSLIGISLLNKFGLLSKAVNFLKFNFQYGLEYLILYKKEIAALTAKFILFYVALESITTAWKAAQNNFEELDKSASQSANRVKELEQALNDLKNASIEKSLNLPINSNNLQLNEGIPIPENFLGLGKEKTYLNLDLFRKGLDNILERFGGNFTTKAEKNLTDFEIAVGSMVDAVNSNLQKLPETIKVASLIKQLDAQLAVIRSDRNAILPGDKVERSKSIALESDLLTQRDKLLRVQSLFQENLSGDANKIKQFIEALDELTQTRAITKDAEKSIRSRLEQSINAINKTKNSFEVLVGELANNLTRVDRALRNISERVAGYVEQQDRAAIRARGAIISQGIDRGDTDTVIQRSLDNRAASDLENRIAYLTANINILADSLSSVANQKVLNRLQGQVEPFGGSINNSETIKRLLEEGRSQEETIALKTLQQLREYQGQLYSAEEGLAQNLQNMRSSSFELHRTTREFFVNLVNQIKETQLEIKRLIAKISYDRLKNQLQTAIVPGVNNFVSELVTSVQSLLEEASSLADELVNREQARLGLQSEKYSLGVGLEDFSRQLKGAADAATEFRNALVGTPNNKQSTDNAQIRVEKTSYTSPSVTKTKSDNKKKYKLGNISLAQIDAPYGTSNLEGSKSFVPGALYNETNETIVKKYLTEKGWKEHQLAAILGTLRQEGQFDPYAFNPKSGASGIGQWLGDRKKNLPALTQNSTTDLLNQLKYFEQELQQRNPYYKGVAGKTFEQQLKNAKNLNEAMMILNSFERFGGWKQGRGASEAGSRYKYAEEYLNEQKPIPVTVTSDPFNKNSFISEQVFEAPQPLNTPSVSETISSGISGIIPATTNRKDPTPISSYQEIPPSPLTTNKKEPTTLPSIDEIPPPPPTTNRKEPTPIPSYDQPSQNQILPFAAPLTAKQILEEQLADLPPSPTVKEAILAALPPIDLQIEKNPEPIQKFELETPINIPPNSPIAQNDPLIDKATELTNELIDRKTDVVDLEDEALRVKEEAFEIKVDQQIQQNSRTFYNDLLGLEQTSKAIDDRLTDFGKTYNLPTAQSELQNNLNSTSREFRDYGVELQGNKLELSDKIKSMVALQQNFQSTIPQLLERGTPADLATVEVMRAINAEINSALPNYQQVLDRVNNTIAALPNLQSGAENFVIEEGNLKIDAERLAQLTNVGEILAQIGEKKLDLGGQQRQALLNEDTRLQSKLVELNQSYRAFPDLLKFLVDSEIILSSLTKKTINLDFALKRIGDQETSFGYDRSISEKEAGRLTGLGLDFQAADINQKNAIQTENQRFARELLELQQKYGNDPLKLDEMRSKAIALNQVSLADLNRQFKDVKETAIDLGRTSLQGFFNDIFSGTKSLGDAFLSMAQTILSSIAQIAAQQAVGGIFNLILGGVTSGLSGGFGGGVGGAIFGGGFAGTFADGGTIAKGLSKEGSKGVLAVFTPGEEILSLKTGEAQRYQNLKGKLGVNPLKAIYAGNFSDGGTILLNNLQSTSKSDVLKYVASVDLGSLKNNQNRSNNTVITANTTIVTPNADSFKGSKHKRDLNMAETYRRALSRK